VKLVADLRGEKGCPWDKKQTPDSVGIYLVEEAFELVEAIGQEDIAEIREELGDVLFHIVFMARMFQEAGQFDLRDVAEGITQKMIRRHPHVFGDRTISGSEEVTQNWHKMKLKEKKSSRRTSMFESVPSSMPSLMRAYRISDRAARSGFEWTEMAGESPNSELVLQNLKAAMQEKDKDLQSEAFGRLLFALVNVCRQQMIHPEPALAAAVKKFEQQVAKMRELISGSNRRVEDLSPAQKAEIWRKIESS